MSTDTQILRFYKKIPVDIPARVALAHDLMLSAPDEWCMSVTGELLLPPKEGEDTKLAKIALTSEGGLGLPSAAVVRLLNKELLRLAVSFSGGINVKMRVRGFDRILVRADHFLADLLRRGYVGNFSLFKWSGLGTLQPFENTETYCEFAVFDRGDRPSQVLIGGKNPDLFAPFHGVLERHGAGQFITNEPKTATAL